MWRVILTVSVLCWNCEGDVTCRNNKNEEVDWYIIYKAPKQGKTLTGLEYIYIDSTLHTKETYTSGKLIDHADGVLANTLRPILKEKTSMQNDFGFISYSDQPPGCHADDEFGHSKGVVMVEEDKSGVWLLHSTPQFPFKRDQNHFWPQSGERNAQTFICVTFPHDQFIAIGKHLQYIKAFPFDHHVPDDFPELINVVNWKSITPSNDKQPLTSNGLQPFFSIAKLQFKESAPAAGSKRRHPDNLDDARAVGDLYTTIANTYSSEVKVQSWPCKQDTSSCPKNGHKVINIESITITNFGVWKAGNDHSKWCVTTDNNKPLICIADVNRRMSQYKRRGGALCFENEAVRTMFKGFIMDTQPCPDNNKAHKMDVDSPSDTDSDCDSDSDK
ncbi:plancitoxin-1-like [Cottoperca gobio]|uniref:Deoxyribonuclease-2-alpha n=1 Tax=Cottoperca gobio TaxID=56716 RepID=A0A6J2QQC4_COTGO|nr:plancitoxin-1-like [Cottoperca gobio]XP_029299512.1 plancitoxin-1-like [Cottoperca gobio]